VTAVHPESVLRTQSGREVFLKVHQCVWSGDFHGNTLEAIEEALRAPVARAEIDIMMLPERGWLVLSHEFTLDMRERLGFRAPYLWEVVKLMAEIRGPTVIELDMMDVPPIPQQRLIELAGTVARVRDKVIFNNIGDWNLRRLHRVEPRLRLAFDPAAYIDSEDTDLPLGAYGYHDAHPLAGERVGHPREYLQDRLGGILRLVPRCEEVHLRLSAFEHMLDDGFAVAEFVHQRGMLLDVWTLDAGTQEWELRRGRALDSGVDMVTTNTPRSLAKA
jgi:glycerophosphoryl diester phosphodiesterase